VDYADTIEPGKELGIKINLADTGDFDLRDLNLRVSIPDLGISDSSKFDLKRNNSVTKTLYLDMPEDAVSGYYDLKITLSNDKISRVLYRDVFVT